MSSIEGDNDGLVSVTSAQWGQHLGVADVDHLQQVNALGSPSLVSGGGDYDVFEQVYGRIIHTLLEQE